MYFYIKNKLWKKRLLWSFVIMFCFFSNGFIVNRFVSLWEVNGIKAENLEQFENGIVLSGMFEYNKDLDRISARRGADRIWQAIQLYKNNKIKKIIITGGSGYVLKKGLHEASQLKKDLISLGIPEEDILVESKSRNTHENAQQTKLLIQKFGLSKQKNLLITSSMHMRRALASYEKEGIHCDPYTTDHYIIHSESISILEFIPSQKALIMWNKLIKEWVGYTIYSIMGYL
jgi:uncharacterized SAM-binding protein YcdF (DUF218 family)